MAAEDVAAALMAIDDGEVRERVLVAYEAGQVEVHPLRPGKESAYGPAGAARAIEYVQGGTYGRESPRPVSRLDADAGRPVSIKEERWQLSRLQKR